MPPVVLLLLLFLLLSQKKTTTLPPGVGAYPPGTYPPGVVPPAGYYPPGGYYPGQQTQPGQAANAAAAFLGGLAGGALKSYGTQPPSAPSSGIATGPSNFSQDAPYAPGAGAYVPYAPGSSLPGPYAPGYVPTGSGDGLLTPSFADASTSSDTSLWTA